MLVSKEMAAIARELLRCATAHESSARLIGNVTAREIADLAVAVIKARMDVLAPGQRGSDPLGKEE